MGRALGLRFAMARHSVFFGGRTASAAPARAAEDAKNITGSPSMSGTLDEAATYADVLLWTLRERDPNNILVGASGASLDGKVIIDLNNRDYVSEVKGPDSKWFSRSLGEELQENLPKCTIVKCFNTIPMETLDVPAENLRASGAQVFVASNDKEAAKTVASLADDIGFNVVHLGGGPTAMRSADALGDVIRFILIDGGMNGANIGIRTVHTASLGIVGPRQSSSYH